MATRSMSRSMISFNEITPIAVINASTEQKENIVIKNWWTSSWHKITLIQKVLSYLVKYQLKMALQLGQKRLKTFY